MQTEKETKIKKKQSIEAQKKARRSEKVCALLFVWCGLVYILSDNCMCEWVCRAIYLANGAARAIENTKRNGM